jgi:hypothetical protein
VIWQSINSVFAAFERIVLRELASLQQYAERIERTVSAMATQNNVPAASLPVDLPCALKDLPQLIEHLNCNSADAKALVSKFDFCF